MLKKTLNVFILLSLFLSACAKKQVKTEDVRKNVPEQTQVVEDIKTVEADSGTITEAIPEADIRKDEFSAYEGIKPVYFAFDKYELSDEARKILNENAKVIKEKKWTVRVDGHCDSRGTTEYNLALGQKRANVVKEYYIKLGVNPENIGTMSFGKEKPVCFEENEKCWAKNRRAETLVNIK